MQKAHAACVQESDEIKSSTTYYMVAAFYKNNP